MFAFVVGVMLIGGLSLFFGVVIGSLREGVEAQIEAEQGHWMESGRVRTSRGHAVFSASLELKMPSDRPRRVLLDRDLAGGWVIVKVLE